MINNSVATKIQEKTKKVKKKFGNLEVYSDFRFYKF